MQTGRIHPDPYAPPLDIVRPDGNRHLYALKRPTVFWLGQHYRLATLVWECVHHRMLPRWHKDKLAFHDGDPWNTRPSNIYLQHIRPRGRPRKNRMQPEPTS